MVRQGGMDPAGIWSRLGVWFRQEYRFGRIYIPRSIWSFSKSGIVQDAQSRRLSHSSYAFFVTGVTEEDGITETDQGTY